MIDSTNPRVMADNIKELSAGQIGQAAELEALDDKIKALGSYAIGEELNTGKKLGDSDIFRKAFHIESMPNNTSENIPHGITNLGAVVNLYGIAQATIGFTGRFFPYGSTPTVRYDATNIIIQTTSDMGPVSAYVFIEYTKSATPSPDISPAPDDTRSIEPVAEVKKTTRKKSTN